MSVSQLRCSAVLTGTRLDVFSQLLNHYYFLLFFIEDLTGGCWEEIPFFFKYLNTNNKVQKRSHHLVDGFSFELWVTLMSEAVGKHSDHRVRHCDDTREANKHRLVTGTVIITPGSRMKCEQLTLIFVPNSWSQFRSNSLDILRTPGDISSRVSVLWRFHLKLDLFHPWLRRSKEEWCSLNSNRGVNLSRAEAQCCDRRGRENSA